MDRRLRYLFRGVALLTVTGLGACGGADKATVRISGQVTIAQHVISGPLLIMALAPGQVLASAASRADGTYVIDVPAKAAPARVLIGAVDPARPDAQAWAVAELSTGTSKRVAAVAAQPGSGSTPSGSVALDLDAGSTASVMVRAAVGSIVGSESDLSSSEQAAVASLRGELESSSPGQCRLGIASEVPAVLKEVGARRHTTVASRFDAFVAPSSSDLVSQLEAAVGHVHDKVSSNNDSNNPVKFVAGFFGVLRTRFSIQATSRLSNAGFGIDIIGVDELERVVDVIMDHGWGNCREKGLSGAYIASRFSQFKQIVVVGIEASTLWTTHALAIACTKDEQTFRLGTFLDQRGEDSILPKEMLAADCYVLDPWLGHAVPLAVDYVKEQGWQDVADLLVVDRGQPTPNPTPSVPLCQVASDPLPIDFCQPFQLPPELAPPPSQPPPSSGLQVVGSCEMDDFTCTIFFGINGVNTGIESMCNQTQGTWRDGPCPTSNSIGACVMSEGQPSQVIVVHYADPQETAPAQRLAEIASSCETAAAGRWQQPYRAP